LELEYSRRELETNKEMADFKASVEKANANLLSSNSSQQQQLLLQQQMKQAELENGLRRVTSELESERKKHKESVANSADLEIKYNKIKAELRIKEKDASSDKLMILDMSRRGADLLHANERLTQEKTALEIELRNRAATNNQPSATDLSKRLAVAEEELRNRAAAGKDEIKELRGSLEAAKDEADMWKSVGAKKISFISLESQDMALFYKNDKQFWQAFSKDQHMFLSDDSRRSLEESKDARGFVIGHIVEKERKVATKESNPFKLPEGSIYFSLTVEIVKLDT